MQLILTTFSIKDTSLMYIHSHINKNQQTVRQMSLSYYHRTLMRSPSSTE